MGLNSRNRKLVKSLSVVVVLLLLIAVMLTYFFNLYPGRYSVEEVGTDQLVVSKGADTYNIKFGNKELQIMLEIYHIQMLWYVGITFVATALISLMNFPRIKYKKSFIFS